VKNEKAGGEIKTIALQGVSLSQNAAIGSKWQCQFHRQLYQIDSHRLQENQFNPFSKIYHLKCFVKHIRQEQDEGHFLPRQGSSAAQ